jgi:hypothetical protein
MKTTLKQYAKDNNMNIMDAWQALVFKGVFEKPAYTAIRESDNAIVVDAEFIKRKMMNEVFTVKSLTENPQSKMQMPEIKVYDKDGFLLATHMSTPVIPSNNDVEIGFIYTEKAGIEMAERKLWEIFGHGLRAHILNLENVEIEV